MSEDAGKNLEEALWQVYRRTQPPVPWRDGVNLPWNDPEFSERMLREHLDQSHGAASRQSGEIEAEVDWLWQRLNLQPGVRLLDITCGPGLYATAFARRGVSVVGLDFSPASIRYAQALAEEQAVADRCIFVHADVRQSLPRQLGQQFDAALFIYGQLAVFTRHEAAQLLRWTAGTLRPGGRLAVELLDFQRIDKKNNTWWFTDDQGLWGDRPFLHLGERVWDEEQRASIDRFFIVDLETGAMQTIGLSDNAYETVEMLEMLKTSGFGGAWAYPAWDGLELYDAAEWVVYVSER